MLAAILSSPEVVTLLGWILATCLVGLVAGCDCCTDCIIHEDAFPDLSNFTVNSGTITSDGTELLIDPGGGVATCDVQDSSDDAQYAEVQVYGDDDGDELELRIKQNDARTAYYFARLTIGASGTFKLFKHTGGSDTELSSVSGVNAPSGQFIRIGMCWKESGILRAFVFDGLGSSLSSNDASITSGKNSAVSASTVTTQAAFQNFSFQHSNSTTWQNCNNCIGDPCDYCGTDQTPDYLLVTISGSWYDDLGGCTTAECASAYNGTFVLTRTVADGLILANYDSIYGSELVEDGCLWEYSYSSPPCAPDTLRVVIYPKHDLTKTGISVIIDNAAYRETIFANPHYFRAELSASYQPDCVGLLSSLSVPWTNSSGSLVPTCHSGNNLTGVSYLTATVVAL